MIKPPRKRKFSVNARLEVGSEFLQPGGVYMVLDCWETTDRERAMLEETTDPKLGLAGRRYTVLARWSRKDWSDE